MGVMGFTLYYANCRGDARNNRYPVRVEVTGLNAFREAVSYDHVAAQYKDNHRSTTNFIMSDCIMLDIDNTNTDNPAEWIQPENVAAAFPGVAFYVCFSRNHMKPKNGKTPRPKFHVYFSIDGVSDSGEYRRQKDAVCAYFPAFDQDAKDAARFFFGVENPQVTYVDGHITYPSL